VVRLDDGGVRLENLAPWFIHVLLELPGMLVPGQGDAVDARLYPEHGDDEERREEWKRLVHPELRALFASAREIVTGDLVALGPEDPEVPFGAWQVAIPAGHIDAWIAALNQARLTLATRTGIEDEDMRDFERLQDRLDEDELPGRGGRREGETSAEALERMRDEEKKHSAIARIHLLAWLQGLLIDEQWPEPEGFLDPNVRDEPPEGDGADQDG